MNAAMIPGNDIRLTDVIVLARCPRCEWRFIAEEGDEYCPDCTENPLWDRDEDKILANKSIFEFMGWKFSEKHIENPCDPRPWVYLLSYKRLFNPEVPGGIYAQANAADIENGKQYCAAWLITHWWEHYLEICPCLKGERDDGEDSNFRRAVIESLLWYSENLEEK